MARTVVPVPSAQPVGEAAPHDGALPQHALTGSQTREFGVYVHIPFCASRCGYCDFNTYTAAELGGGASRRDYVKRLAEEFRLARHVLQTPREVSTVFVGGGTPTLLPPGDLAAIVEMVSDTFGLKPDAEITTEANPETVDEAYLKRLREAGFTRVSLGMQSTAPHVLSVLERAHTPGRAIEAAKQAAAAGFTHINLDLIYGTPGETAEDFDASLRAAIDAGADHVSAYSLIVEDGTRLARRVRDGAVAEPSDDVAADRYLAAERTLNDAGYHWYEVSNWARNEAARCRHNVLYWRGGDWWGFGPGAHSHVGGVRWWNEKHPTRYASLLAAGHSPAAGRETLSAEQRHTERVLLELRLTDGLGAEVLDAAGRAAAEKAVSEGLLEVEAWRRGVARLTLRGRLLADAVVRELLD